ncbi:MAG: glycosyltransferase family 4 protein [Verrucomicrobiota bacterium]
MRIAFISGMVHAPWGGSEVLWSETAQRLLKGGHSVLASVAHWPETPRPVTALQASGCVVDKRQWIPESRLHRRLISKLTRRSLLHPGWEPSWKRIVDFKPDLVCISHGSVLCGVEWMLRCRLASLPYVSVAQANCAHWWPEDGRLDESTAVYHGARRAYFVSKANLDLFERQLGMPLPNGEVVCNPFNVPWDARPSWPEDHGRFKLACVGRLEPAAKGQDLLFGVLSEPKWRERALEVSLFGTGSSGDGLARLAEHDRLGDTVKFGGHIADIESVWRDHHALILPSRYEGLPLSLVEAMLCGRTAIVTDVAGNREVLEDNVTGFLAAAPTVCHLDEAMERAWLQRQHWQSMGTVAAATIRRQVPRDPAQVFADKLLALSQASPS